jgi:hypothetical protein
MVNIDKKLDSIESLINNGKYFVINRPRQYGKTTSIYMLDRRLRNKYIVITCSFEGLGDNLFSNEKDFSERLLNIFARAIKFIYPEESKLLLNLNSNITDLDKLSDAISTFIESCKRPVILFIDEVDKSSNNQLFLSFLGMLRNKFILKEQQRDYSFHSVVLSGVHDIKNLKLRIRENDEKKYNSPWNIAVNFDVDMTFSVEEIESMLKEYKSINNLNFDTLEVAEEIYKFTNGYPYLVSKVCSVIDEKLEKQWTILTVHIAIKSILAEKNTLFDDIIKNVENNQDIKSNMEEILIRGLEVNFNQYVYEKELMYGLLVRKDSTIVVHNKIFEELLYNYFIESDKVKEASKQFRALDKSQFIKNGKLDMEKVVLKFQEVMREEYREEQEDFYEKEGRLIFLAFLKPIINGIGFSFVEPETRQNKRMDIVITYGMQKEIIELKVWRGASYEDKGVNQLAEYLNIQKLDRGYMIIFNFNKNKEYTSNWIELDDKKVFEVMV